MAITRVQLFSVPVTDQDRARDFYVANLGFVVASDTQLGPDMRWLMIAIPGSQTAITLVTWFPTMPAGSVKGIVLETDDLDAAIATLAANGVATSAVEDAPWARFTELADPDGNGIVLQTTKPMPA
jgi:catechol 2,3-dioxygenase-like lactoylglutathione lyase family enzyme